MSKVPESTGIVTTPYTPPVGGGTVVIPPYVPPGGQGRIPHIPVVKKPKEIYGIYCVYRDGKVENQYIIADEKEALAIQSGKFNISYEDRAGFDDKDFILHPTWKQALLVHIDRKDIPVSGWKQRGVACCAYNATNHYIKSIIGGELVKEDNDWYTLNDMVTSHGLPQGNSFAVLQQLVEPYNLGISRITIPPGSQRFPLYEPFIASLGCNPFFLTDGMTTNEEALEKMFPDKAERDIARPTFLAMWRFDCSKTPLSPSIFMNQFNTTQAGHNGGSSYRAPRSKHAGENWIMSIQLDRLSNINYLQPVELPEYKEWEGELKLDIEGVKDEDGKTIRALKAALPRPSIPENLNRFFGRNNNRGQGKAKDYPPVCETCQKDPGHVMRAGQKFCQYCYTVQEKDYQEDLWNAYQGSGLY